MCFPTHFLFSFFLFVGWQIFTKLSFSQSSTIMNNDNVPEGSFTRLGGSGSFIAMCLSLLSLWLMGRQILYGIGLAELTDEERSRIVRSDLATLLSSRVLTRILSLTLERRRTRRNLEDELQAAISSSSSRAPELAVSTSPQTTLL